MDISQFRLNLERVCVRFYGSINPIESVNYHIDEPKMGTSKMAVSKSTVCPRSYIQSLYWKATEVIVDTTSNSLSWC